jgi:dephospho-CoA kinase
MGMVLGLTGGIATGKSTVVNFFREYGFPIVDADQVARQVVETGQPGLLAIIAHFGQEILLGDGSLDRKKLGQLIFANPKERRQLDRLLDPILRAEITKQIAAKQQQSSLVIADIPLLFEANYRQVMDQVAVVYTSEDKQLERLMARNLLTEEEAKQRIASQMSIELKKEQADIVFDNQGTLEETKQQVNNWLQEQKLITEL